MMCTYQRLKRQREAGEIDGFTLIELLIVIVVLGILAAVVIFALGGITGKSALASCQADGATVSTALAAFEAQNPSTFTNVSGSGGASPVPPTTFVSGSSTYTEYYFNATTGGYVTTPVANTVGTIAIGTPTTTATIPPNDAAMENALSSTTNYSGPYIQSWPNNAQHYGYVMGWVLQTPYSASPVTQATWSAQLFIVTGNTYAPVANGTPTYTTGNATWNGNLTQTLIDSATPVGISSTVPALYAYTGPGSCTNVS